MSENCTGVDEYGGGVGNVTELRYMISSIDVYC